MDQPHQKASGRQNRSQQSVASFTSDGEEIRYPAHLRWTCVRCTNSCRDIPGRKRNILLTQSDIDRVIAARKLVAEEFSELSRGPPPYDRKMKKIEGRCMFLEGSSCSIYEARPLICRFYPFSLSPSEDGGLKVGFDSTCSGIGKGPVLGEEFFQDLVKLANRALCRQ